MHPLGNRAENHEVGFTLAATKHHVFDKASAVPESKCSPADNRIFDAVDTVGLTSVNGNRKHLARQVLECGLVSVGQEALFWPGDVEANHTVVAVAHRQLGNLETAIQVSHSCDQLAGANAVTLVGGLVYALLEPILHCCDNLVERETLVEVLLWCPANLAVDDPVGGQIEHKLLGNPL